MSSLNKVMLIGNVGKDPEIRTMDNGKRLASFSIATAESWKDKETGERKENTQWHNVVVFNDALVGVIERYVKKGSKVFVEGSQETRKWVNKDGNDQYSTETVLKAFNGTLVLLDKPASDAEGRRAEHNRKAADVQAPDYVPDLDDDIPFAWVSALIAPISLLLGIASSI